MRFSFSTFYFRNEFLTWSKPLVSLGKYPELILVMVAGKCATDSGALSVYRASK